MNCLACGWLRRLSSLSASTATAVTTWRALLSGPCRKQRPTQFQSTSSVKFSQSVTALTHCGTPELSVIWHCQSTSVLQFQVQSVSVVRQPRPCPRSHPWLSGSCTRIREIFSVVASVTGWPWLSRTSRLGHVTECGLSTLPAMPGGSSLKKLWCTSGGVYVSLILSCMNNLHACQGSEIRS